MGSEKAQQLTNISSNLKWVNFNLKFEIVLRSRQDCNSQSSRETATCACLKCKKKLQSNGQYKAISLTEVLNNEWGFKSLPHNQTCSLASCVLTSSGDRIMITGKKLEFID